MAIKFLNTVQVDTDVLYVDAANDRVGIGTNNPGAKLEVSGSIKLSETAATTDTDKFVVLDSGVLKYRTGSQVRSDIGAGIGNITGITAGTYLTGGGNNGNVTVNADSTQLAHIHDSSNGTVTAGWITVAQASGARKAGEIYVTDGESSDHSYIRIEWMRSYADSNFTVLNCGGHANRIVGVRVLEETADKTYGKKYIQVKVTTSSNYYVIVTAPGEIPNYGDFIAETPVLENTKTGYNVKGSELENLQDSSIGTDQGITVGGSLFVDDNVGIGTTSPGAKLDIIGSAIGLRVKKSDLSDVLRVYSQGSGIYMNNGNVHISDNLGIGTTSPSTKLHVQGAASGYLFRVQGTSTLNVYDPGAAAEIGVGSGSGDKLKLFSNDSLDNGITIDTSGDVGIGTTNPGGALDVVSAYLSTLFRVSNTEANATTKYGTFMGRHYTNSEENITGMLLTSSSNGLTGNRVSIGGGISAANAVNEIIFYTASNNTTLSGSERMRITNSGNVGIGTTAPSAKLEVIGTIKQKTGAGYTNYVQQSVSEAQLTFSTYSINQSSFPSAIKFSPNGSEAMRVDNNGNVGIGTTSPSQKLHVNGTTYSTNGYKLNNGFSIGALGYNSAIRFNNGNILVNNSSSAEFVRFDATNSRVGIGTTSPQQKLHISNGGIRVEKYATGLGGFVSVGNATETAGNYSAYFFGNTALDGSYFKGGIAYETLSSTNGRGDMHFLQNSVANSTNATIADSVMTILNSGNVGIGTTSPSQKLEVNGAVLASDYRGSTNVYLTSPDSWIFRSTGGSTRMQITSAGNVGIGTTSPNAKLQVSDNVRVGNTSTGVRFYIQGVDEFRADALDVSGNGWNSLHLRADGTDGLFLQKDTNNVGIGTTSPSVELDVNGTSKVDTGITEGIHYVGTALEHWGDGGTGLSFPYNDALTLKTASSDRLHINSNGNVGIGTTSPQSKLHVLGGTTLPSPGADGGAAVFGNTSSTDYGLVLGTETSGKSYIQSQRNDGTATTYALLVQPNGGNVGIGTTSPLSKLNVNGSIKIEGENQLYFGSSGSTPLWGIKALGNDLIISEQGTNSGDLIFTGENLGVGTTSPNDKLDVNGTVRTQAPAASDWGLISLNSAGSASSGLWFNNGSGELLLRRSDNSIQTKIASTANSYINGGDVGIGTTNPSERLHVSGEAHPSIRLSSSSDSNYNVVINCGYRNEALNLSVGGYKVFTTEGYNTPETTHLYSNNSKALSLASNQAATFTSTVTATNFINSSDERLKENIEKVRDNSLDVKWKTFEFKSDKGQKRYGVIAQELEKTNPEFVREDDQGFKSVAYIDLLIAKIAELEERIQELEK